MVWCCCSGICTPDSTPDTIIVLSDGCAFVNGIPCTFSTEYDAIRFQDRLSKIEFVKIMDEMNEILMNYLPCPCCWTLGYLFAIPTLGYSLVIMYKGCVRDAEWKIRHVLKKKINEKLHDKGLHLELRKRCCVSWFEFSVIGDVLKNI